jgi:hypothetical protein
MGTRNLAGGRTMGRRRWLCLAVVVFWGLSGCATAPGTGLVGMGESELVAAKGQPQEIIAAPQGGKILVYETSRMDQLAIMGAGAWGKPEQTYYWLNAQGKVTRVDYYPYGKRKFLFPTTPEAGKQAPVPAPTTVAAAPAPAPPPVAAAPSPAPPPVAATPKPQPPATAPAVAAPAVPRPTLAPPPAPQQPQPVISKPAPPPPAVKGMAQAAGLEIGMKKEAVMRLLGVPDRTEGFRAGGKAVVIWSYRLAGQGGRKVLTPLVFENNTLAGWGDAYYQIVIRKVKSQP